MAKEKAETGIVKLIYKLASNPSLVRVTSRAYYDMLAYNITRDGLCEAIQKWIQEGKSVLKDITTEAQPYIGEVHYVMKPIIDKQKMYVKVGKKRILKQANIC